MKKEFGFIKFKVEIRKYGVMKLRHLLTVVIVSVILIGCRNNRPANLNRDIEEETTGFDQMEEMKEIYYRFPAPDEMLNFIDNEELIFNDGILLPVEYAKNYLDSRSQSLNLGVYIADLAYITLFQRQKEALTYFEVVYGLSEKLRMSSAFNNELLKRFEDNLNNPDSLKSLSDEAMTDITDYLVANNKEQTFAVISIGGYIEGLYLSFNLAGEFNEDNMIVQRISDQKLVMENLINYALEFAGDNYVSESIEMLHPIRSVFNELSVTTAETEVERSEDGKLVISGGEKITITEEQYDKLKLATFSLRKSITENLEN